MYIRWRVVLDGINYGVNWDDGKLTGDAKVVNRVRALAFLYDGLPVGPPAVEPTYHSHLANPYSTGALVREVADRIDSETSNVPPVEYDERNVY